MAGKGNPETIYDFTAKDIDGHEVSMEKYRGHVCIIFNGACKCGLTEKNYVQFQAMYEEFGSKGLKILAFPCNQFGSQEPWPEPEIKAFLKDNYNVTFDLFSKIDVNGSNTHPLFKFLKEKQGGTFGNFIKWNFTKFLINKEGVPVKRYSPTTDPFDIKNDLPPLW